MANAWAYVEKELDDLEAEVNALLVERNRLLNRSDKAEKLVLQNLLYTVGCGLTGAIVALDWLPLSMELFSAKMEIRRLKHERGMLRTKILSLRSLAVTLAGGIQSEATRLGELIPSHIESRTESVLDSIDRVPGVEREIESSERRIWYMSAGTVAAFLGSCYFILGRS